MGKRPEPGLEIATVPIRALGEPPRLGGAEAPDIEELAPPPEISSTSAVTVDEVEAGTVRPLAVGTCIGHYEIIRELGRGGMARVYLARDLKLGRRVAIKFIGTHDPRLAQRFVAEARATAQCSHDNIVVIHEVDVFEGNPYMVLEYLEGRPLHHLAREGLSVDQILDYMIPVVRAMERAHAAGIVHRDLKPENVIVTSGGRVKVLDFGVSKGLEDIGGPRAGSAQLVALAGNPELTGAGGLVGTPTYMSPEQYGVGTVDHRTDIWAVGIMLFRLISGRHPAGEPTDRIHLHTLVPDLDRPFPSLSRLVMELPEGLAEVVDRCLAKRAEDRWGSAKELREALEAIRGGTRANGPSLAEDDCPFPGLRAFQEEDADRFFGRSAEIARGHVRLRDIPLLAVVGPSGVGKSSFVRAGLIPTLKRRGEHWQSAVLRPGRRPMAALASLLIELGDDRTVEEIIDDLYASPGQLGAALRQRARSSQASSAVFVDQFEELYTLGASDRERAGFAACLGGLADDARSPMRLILSIRTDLLDRVTEHPELADAITRGLMLLSTPGRLALHDALTEPLRLSGYSFEESTIVDDLLDGLSSARSALPLLQFVAATLWSSRDVDSRLLTRAAYDELGGVAGALAKHADTVLRALDASSQKTVRAMFHRLVTPDRTRAVVDKSELIELAPSERDGRRLVDYLVSERLLVVQSADSGAPSVEIVHESLITAWPTLRRWIDEDAGYAAFVAQVKAAARQWKQQGRPDGLLWTGEAAAEAMKWREDSALAAIEREFLDGVVRLATRSVRVRRFLAIAGLVLLAAIAAGGIGASVMIARANGVAERKAEEAVAEARRAKAAEDAANSARGELATQLELLRKKEAERRAAVEKADSASAEVALSREELRDANTRLRTALDTARAESQKAKALAAEQSSLAKRLKILLEKEKARAEKLRRQKKKISTELR